MYPQLSYKIYHFDKISFLYFANKMSYASPVHFTYTRTRGKKKDKWNGLKEISLFIRNHF